MTKPSPTQRKRKVPPAEPETADPKRLADVLGQLKDGRLLGVEVKSPTGRLRPEQAAFLETIRAAGGVGFVARDLRDVRRELQAPEVNT